ncbi:MerR family transcriptional regulator [Prauserella cavernicola]|uniref:MerR family transcriptional regulator n=1 Tax=Prauserella cavernicola TaxID=2800127 RepID=A0A934QSD6_9PSEU|nr:MerR family transcriptional regulator [Prauserella cavernicola]MBK1787357.1 MerR family transcriptional regulator [Prauserella cavernicola]
MAWSTRELADLAGTTVNTIRHYHRLGLLAEPERRYNGYKQYGVGDLVRLLRIRRLALLGVPLSQIGDVGAGTEDNSAQALRDVDAQLVDGIERLQRARASIAAILRDGAPIDTPEGFESVAARLSEADSSMVHIYSRLYDEKAMSDLHSIVRADADSDGLGDALNALAPDADEATRQRLAERLAPALARNIADYPWLRDPTAHLANSEPVTRRTFIEALVELYSPAQLDVLARASVLVGDQSSEDDTPQSSP